MHIHTTDVILNTGTSQQPLANLHSTGIYIRKGAIQPAVGLTLRARIPLRGPWRVKTV